MRRAACRFAEVLVVCTTVGVAACTTDPIAPPSRLAAPTAPNRDVALSASGRYLVLFTNDIPSSFATTVASLGGKVKYSSGGAGIAIVEGLNAAGAASLASSSGVSEVGLDAVVSIKDGMPVQTMAAPDALAQRLSTGIASPGNPATAFFFGQGWQWNMLAINANKAWAAGDVGSPSVTVAIIDSGIDYRGLDLAGLVDLSRSTSFVPSDDALVGALFPGVNTSTDLNGHGTLVAEQIASNALAFAGITSRSRLISVKTQDVNGEGFIGNVAAGIVFAADEGADVANLSVLGSIAKSGANGIVGRLLNRVAQYANKKGLLLVSAAGNDAANIDKNGDTTLVFCEQPHVVCVSATGPLTPNDAPTDPAVYTNFGTSAITVAGPGGNFTGPLANWPWGLDDVSWVWGVCSKTTVIVDANGNPIATPFTSGNFICGAIGTSLATPHVTGLAALLVSVDGKVGPTALTNLITKSAIDLGKPGRDAIYGSGFIDVGRALGM